MGSFFGAESAVDFFNEVKLSRTLYSKDKKFVLIPAISIQAGTQNFYEAYYQASRLGNRKGSGNQQTTNSQNITIEEATNFSILNYELSLPLQYYHKSFIFSWTPVVALPQNAAEIVTDDYTFQEELDTLFYWSVGISYWIPLKDQ